MSFNVTPNFCRILKKFFGSSQVRDFGKSVDTRVVTFDTPSCNGGVSNPSGDRSDDQKRFDAGTKYCRRAIRIDELSRLLFPFAFLIFNVLYWSYYTQWAK